MTALNRDAVIVEVQHTHPYKPGYANDNISRPTPNDPSSDLTAVENANDMNVAFGHDREAQGVLIGPNDIVVFDENGKVKSRKDHEYIKIQK